MLRRQLSLTSGTPRSRLPMCRSRGSWLSERMLASPLLQVDMNQTKIWKNNHLISSNLLPSGSTMARPSDPLSHNYFDQTASVSRAAEVCTLQSFDSFFSHHNRNHRGMATGANPTGRRTVPLKMAASPTASLSKYGRDLTEAAKNGQLDPVIGRDEVVRRCLQVKEWS